MTSYTRHSTFTDVQNLLQYEALALVFICRDPFMYSGPNTLLKYHSVEFRPYSYQSLLLLNSESI